MKIFHLSDLHIGLKLINRDLREDQEFVLSKISEFAKKEQPDVVVVAGDIFDKSVPSAESYEIFDNFISELTVAVPNAKIMMISGNHDSASRVNVYRSILSKNNIYMIGQPPLYENEHIEKIIISDEYGNVNFYLLPFVKPSMVKSIVGTDKDGNNLSYDDSVRALIEREEINETERNVLVSHQFYLPREIEVDGIERMDSEIKTVGNIDQVYSDVLVKFDYAALGHIHKPMKVGSEYFRYPGTPLACSVSEANQSKGIIVIDMGKKGEIETSVLELQPLRKVKVIEGSLEEVIGQACEDYVSVVLTDKVEHDALDVKDRLNKAFPFLLEIRRNNIKNNDYKGKKTTSRVLAPFDLCSEFLGEDSDEYSDLLMDLINTVREDL